MAQLESPAVARVSYVGVIGVLLLHVFVFAAILAVLIKIVPHYMRLFELTNIELPEVTILVVKWSYLAVDYWPFLLLALLMVDGVLIGLLGHREPTLLSIYSHVVLFGMILMLLTIHVGLAIPMDHVAAIIQPAQ